MGFQEHGLAFQVITDGRGHGGGATAAPWWAAAAAQGFAAKFPISSGEFSAFGRLCYHDSPRMDQWMEPSPWLIGDPPPVGRCRGGRCRRRPLLTAGVPVGAALNAGRRPYVTVNGYAIIWPEWS
jgi:hypothetical protein